jgi:hypothetical protein
MQPLQPSKMLNSKTPMHVPRSPRLNLLLSNRSHTGFYAATDEIFVFLPLQSYLNSSTISQLLSSSSSEDISPLQKQQFAIQTRNIQSASSPQTETIHYSRGLFPPLADVSYMSMLSGVLVSPKQSVSKLFRLHYCLASVQSRKHCTSLHESAVIESSRPS